jgi:type II secretory pathway pseudopilin PulG
MMRGARAPAGGFFVLQSTVAVVVAALLIAIMLLRTQQYHEEAERQSVQQTVDTLRAALRLRVTETRRRSAAVAPLADENPFDWLEAKPGNYLGEYYSPELNEIPVGNWLFDRRDKSVIYLLNTHESFLSGTSKFIKFKVEFDHAQFPRVKDGPAEAPTGLVIVPVDDEAAKSTD